MSRRLGIWAVLTALSCAGLHAAETSILTVDWNKTHQTIVGFGGTMGWIHPGDAIREDVFDLLFKDLGASVLRIRALGGEGGDELSIEPKNDNDDPDSFNWTAFPVYLTEAKNALIMKGALNRGVKTIIPASWSPPGWMKDTGTRKHGGSLLAENREEFAEAWAAYVIGLKREFGITIRLLSIQNEPDLTYYYPTCSFSPESCALGIKAVQERLDRENLGVTVVGPDVCRIYNLERYRDEMLDQAYATSGGTLRPKPLLTHLYDLTISFDEVDRDAERWQKARAMARQTGQPLWLMETANYLSHGVNPASYLEGLIWARKIHHALADGDCEVVCYWSLFFDKRGEALIYCAKSADSKYEITPKFYTSMNYYRFVRPGMKRVQADLPDDDLFVTAFKDGEKRRRVVVVVNWSHAAQQLDVSALGEGEWQRFETTSKRNCVAVEFAAPRMRIPARSVTTLVQAAARPASPAEE